MRFIRFVFATALVLSIGSAACSGAPEEVATESSQSDLASTHTLKLTKADDGKTVTVAPGESVFLSLPESASTGYSWMIEDDDLGDPTRHDVGGDPSRPGSGGHVTFTWSTVGVTGSHTITLVLQRPWAETTPPIDRFSVTLDLGGRDCRSTGCADGEWCSMCWGQYACIPNGAMC
jgi:inhibitor of cysteine peptidase